MNWTLLGNSLTVAFGAATLSFLLGLAAVLGSLSAGWLRRPVLAGAVVALALPSFQVVNSWMSLFGLAGVAREWAPFELYSTWGAVLLLASMFWPVSFFCLWRGMAGVSRDLAEMEPALRGWAWLRHAVWPAARGFATPAWLLPLALALNQFSVPALLQVKTYPAEVWIRFTRDFALGEALWAALPLLAGPLLAVWALGALPTSPGGLLAPESSLARSGPPRLSPGLRALFGLGACGVLLASVGLPLGALLGSKRAWVELLPGLAASRSAAVTSLAIAGSAAAVVLLLGWCWRWRGAAPMALALFLLPGTLVGMAALEGFNRPGLSWILDSGVAVVAAVALRCLLVAVLGFSALRRGVDARLRDSLRLWSGGRMAEWRWLAWPHGKTLILSLCAMTFTWALWEVESLILLIPPGSETLSLRVFNMLHYGHAGQVDALCVWMLAMAALPWLAAGVARWMTARRSMAGLGCVALLAGGCSPRAMDGQAPIQVEGSLFDRVTLIGTRGAGAGQFNKPRSVVADREGNIYAVDMTGRVQKFSPSGSYLLGWQMERTEIGRPKGMALDHEGQVVVVEPHYCRVNYFDTHGKLTGWFGERGKEGGLLMFPRAAAVAADGTTYLSEYGLVERVQSFGPGGKAFIRSFGSPGTEPGEFNRPEGLGLDAEGRLFVADSCNHRVQIFTPEGTFVTAFGKAGQGLGELSYPYDVRVDREGNRFVCEFGNSRVQVFDRDNRPVEFLGASGGPGALANPWAIALDGEGNLIVADSMNHRLQKFWRKRALASGVAAEALN